MNGEISAVCNAGGVAGMTMGAWTIFGRGTYKDIYNSFRYNYDGNNNANAFWTELFANAAYGSVTATGENGTAGGITGLSVYSHIYGAVSGAAVSSDADSGVASGIAGQMYPSFWGTFDEDDTWRQNNWGMRAVVNTGTSSADASERAYDFTVLFETGAVNNEHSKGECRDVLEQMKTRYVMQKPTDSANAQVMQSFNSTKNTTAELDSLDIPDLKEVNGRLVFTGSTVTSGNVFAMAGSYTYGDTLTPTAAVNVASVSYRATSGTDYGTTAPTGAGNYTATATFLDGSTATVNFSITKRTVNLADPEETELAYTGKARTVNSPYITNLVPGDDVTLVVEGNTGTAKRDYTLTVTGLTGADAGNYQLPEGGYSMSWSITDKLLQAMTPNSITLSSSIPSTDWIFGVPVTVGEGDSAVTVFDGDSFRIRDLVQVTANFDSGSMTLDVDAQGMEWVVLSTTTLSVAKNEDGEAVATVLQAGTCELQLQYSVNGTTVTSDRITFTVRDARYPQYIDFTPTDALMLSLDGLHGYTSKDLSAYTITATDQYGSDYEGSDVTWVSTNTSVAKVEDGKLVAVGEGTTFLKLVWGEGTAKRTESQSAVSVTVNAAAVPETLTLSISERTLYQNLNDGRQQLCIDTGVNDSEEGTDDIAVTLLDQFGDSYTPKAGESLAWSFAPDAGSAGCAVLADGVLTAQTNGSGTLTATFSSEASAFTPLTAEVKITVATFSAIQEVSYTSGADYVRLGQSYDLTQVPLEAVDNFGNAYTLSDAELQSITWTFDSTLSTNAGVTAEIAGSTLTVSAAQLDGSGKEDSINLDGAISNGNGGTVEFRVELTIREVPQLAEIIISTPESLSLRPQEQKKIDDYFTVVSLDQYGDGFALESPVWASDDTAILSVAGNTHLQGNADGTANVTLSDGSITSNAVPVTVASVPFLTRIEITNAPSSMAYGQTLDVSTLTVAFYDQLNRPMEAADRIYWSISSQNGAAAAFSSETVLISGQSRGKFVLQASVNASIVAEVPIYVGPQVTAITPAETTLSSAGGNVTFRLTGEHLTAGLTLGLFGPDAGEPVATAETTLSGVQGSGVLTAPANEGEAAVTYTVKISYDGGVTYESTIRGEADGEAAPTATVTVLQPGETPPTPPGGGGGGGGGIIVDDPENVTTEDNASGETITTAVPDTESNGSTASATVDADMGSAIVEQARNHNSQTVVIAPEYGSNITSAEVTIPAETLRELGDTTEASLTVETPAADIGLPNEALTALGSGSGDVTIVTERSGNTVTLEILTGGEAVETVPGGVKLTVPYTGATAGTVAVAVRADGTREVLHKSIVSGEKILVLADGPVTIEIVENSHSFADVLEGDWFHESVDFASSHELFYGISDTLFSPNTAMTRGMLMTVLARYDGQDTSGGENWYDAGVAWAVEHGISDGTMPEESITREQIVTILYRYAGSPAVSGTLDFPDADTVSDYAMNAMLWAVSNGILSGYDTGLLEPQGDTTRAQVAAIIMRFCRYEMETLPF